MPNSKPEKVEDEAADEPIEDVALKEAEAAESSEVVGKPKTVLTSAYRGRK